MISQEVEQKEIKEAFREKLISWSAHKVVETGRVMILAIRQDGLAEAVVVSPDIDVWNLRAVIKTLRRRFGK